MTRPTGTGQDFAGLGVKVQFDGVQFDTGNHFDTSSGRYYFVAPEDGYYVASATVTSIDPPEDITIFLAKWRVGDSGTDAQGIANGTAYGTRSPTTAAMVTSVVYLQTGDRLAVAVRNASDNDTRTADYDSANMGIETQNMFVVHQLP
jgi:hypothetical protein